MSMDNDAIHPLLKVAMQIVPGVAKTLGEGVEVLVNDFSHPESAMLAIAGNITGRQPGAPLSDMMLKLLRQGRLEDDVINYSSRTPDGRDLRSSTILIRDEEGKVLGCFWINVDLTHWQVAKRLIDNYCRAETPEGLVPELFRPDVESMLCMHIDEVIEKYAIPVTLMKKEDKLVVVQELDERGVFLIRGAVNNVAKALGVSRYTIYNYLEEIKSQQDNE